MAMSISSAELCGLAPASMAAPCPCAHLAAAALAVVSRRIRRRRRWVSAVASDRGGPSCITVRCRAKAIISWSPRRRRTRCSARLDTSRAARSLMVTPATSRVSTRSSSISCLALLQRFPCDWPSTRTRTTLGASGTPGASGHGMAPEGYSGSSTNRAHCPVKRAPVRTQMAPTSRRSCCRWHRRTAKRACCKTVTSESISVSVDARSGVVKRREKYWD
mmetsp:Transcript_27853/g.70636  ORF Transcript_27853/g.70636 Transcript_27853/m.70636 type:complete len:219 (-) Transcript_27853:22-678(-)